jgi:transposase
VEKYRAGLGYRKISETLNIPWSTIKSIIKKWKEYGTTTNLPRVGRPPKLTDQAISVHRTTLSHTLHRAGLYGRVAKKANA